MGPHVRLQIWSHLVQSVHAEFVAHETGGVGWESSEQDGNTAFVHGSDPFFLHQVSEDVADAAVLPLWSWNYKRKFNDDGCTVSLS